MVDGGVDGIGRGWLDKLGSCDGCELGVELGTDVVLIDGSSEACKEG